MKQRIGATQRIHGHDVHVRFTDRTFAALQAFAGASGLALNGCIRLLVERSLAIEAGSPPGDIGPELLAQLKALNQGVLSGLIATEQSQRLLVRIVPGGAQLCEELFEESAAGARRRLFRLEEAIDEEVG